MTHLYGKEIGDRTQDSVMTTVAVVMALFNYLKLMISSSSELASKNIEIRRNLLKGCR